MSKTVPDVDAFGCFIIKMHIIKAVYMLQMLAFQVHITTIMQIAGMDGPQARARHWVKHLAKGRGLL